MPFSLDEGKDFIADFIEKTKPQSVLDVGPGSGSYGKMVKTHVPYATVDAVEIFEPYIKQFNLRSIYSQVYLGDYLDIGPTLSRYEVVILGDVIEHFNDEDAMKCWEISRRVADKVICSTPIVEWPQGAEHGNIHETHLSYFPKNRLKALPGVSGHWFGDRIGVVIADGLDKDTVDVVA